MKVQAPRFSIATVLLATLSHLMLVHVANAMYFYAEPDTWRCFQDTIVSNYVSNPANELTRLDPRDGGIDSRQKRS